MSNQKLASFALLFILSQTLLIGVASAGNHNQVLDCSVDGVHATLLRYAALAEIAYEAPGSHDLHLYRYCPETSISTFDSDAPLEQVTLRNLPEGSFTRYASEVCPDTNSECIRIFRAVRTVVRNRVHTVEPTGEELVTCDKGQSRGERIALVFSFVRRNSQLSLFTKMVLFVGSSVSSGDEELRVIEIEGLSDGVGTEVSAFSEYKALMLYALVRSIQRSRSCSITPVFLNSRFTLQKRSSNFATPICLP